MLIFADDVSSRCSIGKTQAARKRSNRSARKSRLGRSSAFLGKISLVLATP
jgi:hypothetical protein